MRAANVTYFSVSEPSGIAPVPERSIPKHFYVQFEDFNTRGAAYDAPLDRVYFAVSSSGGRGGRHEAVPAATGSQERV